MLETPSERRDGPSTTGNKKSCTPSMKTNKDEHEELKKTDGAHIITKATHIKEQRVVQMHCNAHQMHRATPLPASHDSNFSLPSLNDY